MKQQLKDAQKALDGAFKVLEKSAKGLPENIAALKNISKDESALINKGMGKYNSIISEMNKEMADLNDLK